MLNMARDAKEYFVAHWQKAPAQSGEVIDAIGMGSSTETVEEGIVGNTVLQYRQVHVTAERKNRHVQYDPKNVQTRVVSVVVDGATREGDMAQTPWQRIRPQGKWTVIFEPPIPSNINNMLEESRQNKGIPVRRLMILLPK